MISQTKKRLEAPAPNFGVDANAHIRKMNNEFKQLAIKLGVFAGVPLIVGAILAAIFIGSLASNLMLISLLLLPVVGAIGTDRIERAACKDYNKEMGAKISSWAENVLVPYLHEEHNITVLGENYEDLFRPSVEGMRAKTGSGEAIRFKVDGVTLKKNGFTIFATFDPELFGVMVLQKAL